MVLLDALVDVVLAHLDTVKGCPYFQFEALQGTATAILQHTRFYQHVSSLFPPSREPASPRPFSLWQVQRPRQVCRELFGPQHHLHLQEKAARWLLLSHASSMQIHSHNRRVCSSSAIPHSTAVREQGPRSWTAHTLITKTKCHKTRTLLDMGASNQAPQSQRSQKPLSMTLLILHSRLDNVQRPEDRNFYPSVCWWWGYWWIATEVNKVPCKEKISKCKSKATQQKFISGNQLSFKDQAS